MKYDFLLKMIDCFAGITYKLNIQMAKKLKECVMTINCIKFQPTRTWGYQ